MICYFICVIDLIIHKKNNKQNALAITMKCVGYEQDDMVLFALLKPC